MVKKNIRVKFQDGSEVTAIGDCINGELLSVLFPMVFTIKTGIGRTGVKRLAECKVDSVYCVDTNRLLYCGVRG